MSRNRSDLLEYPRLTYRTVGIIGEKVKCLLRRDRQFAARIALFDELDAIINAAPESLKRDKSAIQGSGHGPSVETVLVSLRSGDSLSSRIPQDGAYSS